MAEPNEQQQQQAEQQAEQPAEQQQQQAAAPERITELTETVNMLRDQNQQMQEQMRLYQSNLKPAEPRSDDPLSTIDDDSVVMGSEIKGVIRQLMQQNQALVDGMSIRAQSPDIESVLRAEIPKLTQENPQLASALSGPNAVAVALYHLAKTRQELASLKQNSQQANDQLNAASRTLPAASQAGQSSAAGDLASLVSTLSDEEFIKRAEAGTLPLR